MPGTQPTIFGAWHVRDACRSRTRVVGSVSGSVTFPFALLHLTVSGESSTITVPMLGR
jgi:hypothetical protein